MAVSAIRQLERDKAVFGRVEPPCPYFGSCGGCALQDLLYADQLALKRRWLIDTFAPLGDLPEIELIGLDDPWRYRNKAEFSFGETDGRLTLGYHAPNSFWRVIDLEDCLLMPEPAMRVVRGLRDVAAETQLPAYQPRTHRGFYRYAIIRYSQSTGAMLICVVTASGSREVIAKIAETLTEQFPEVSSVYWGRTDRLADVAVPEELVLMVGTPYLEEQLGSFRLLLDPASFLQSATVQANRMYERLCDFLDLGGAASGVAWDLYCGIGLIGFYLSKRFRKVYGIDSEPRNIELARLNAARNGIENIEFCLGQVESVLQDRRRWLQAAKPDLIIVDPPRAGIHPRALPSLQAARPKHLAYISCNMQSLVRDLAALFSGYPRYRLRLIQAFDMFPQTRHVETLVLLERKSS